MAEVPDMYFFLMDSCSNPEEEFYTDEPCLKKPRRDLHCSKSVLTYNSGITLETTEQREYSYSFKKTAVLVLAVEKLRKRTKDINVFSDTDLLGLCDNIVVEEEILCDESESTFGTRSSYHTYGSEDYKIKDITSKCFALEDFSGDAKLVALQLQGVNADREEIIKMDFYTIKDTNAPKKKYVALALKNHNLYLSCVSAGGVPELQLENIKNDDLERFIFLKTGNSPNVFSRISFESAAFPGWYISTSQKENELVRMAPQDQKLIREFELFK
ncbi:interleukin-1 beta-like [Discoglossus pictus]